MTLSLFAELARSFMLLKEAKIIFPFPGEDISKDKC